MALLGMGANMQYDGCFPGYYSTMDLNMDANSSTWPLNNINKMLEHGHHYNGFLPPFSADQVLGYNKEVLKQMMLKHETMFRDQIHELHRLYGRQRELMYEMRRNELDKCNVRLETSQSNSFLSHVSTEYAQTTCHAPRLPWVNPACGGLSILGVENVQLPLSSIQGKCMQRCPDRAQTEGCLKKFELLESKCKKIGKKILDLQLPADVYIDSEEEELLEDEKVHEVPDVSNYPSEEVNQVMCKDDVKPFPGSIELNDIFHEEASTSLLKKSTCLADLNDPVMPEEEAAPNSDFVVPTSHHIPCLDLSQKTKSAFQISSEEIVQNNQTRWDLESCSNVLLSEKKERKQGWPSFNDEAGNSRSNLNSFPEGFDAEKVSMLHESSQEEIKQAHQSPIFHLLNQNYQKSESKRTSFGFESFGRNHSPPSDSQPGPSGASYMCTSHELIPQADMTISGFSPAAFCRKPECDMLRNPISVEALPCFNTSVSLVGSSKTLIGRPGLDGKKSHPNKSSESSIKCESVGFLQGGFCNSYHSGSNRSMAHSPSISFDNLNSNNNNDLASEHQGLANYVQDSMDVKSSKDINLNFMPNFCSLDVEASQSIRCTDGKEKLGELTGGLPWLRAKRVHYVGSTKGSEDSTQVDSVLLKTYSECVPDVESKNNEASDSLNNRRIIDLPIYDKGRISYDQCSSHASLAGDEIENTEKDGLLDTHLTCDPVHDSGKCPTENENVLENGFDKRHVGFGGHDDLNLCGNEDKPSPMHIFSAEIDLVPASPENKECSPPRGESDENQLETTCQLSGQEEADLQKELVRTAAEAIVSISSSVVEICLENTTCKPFEASTTDSLHWFAGIVSSVVGDNEFGVVLSGKNGDHHDESLPDGMDYFEAMTLKLTETKLEECCCKSSVQKEEEGCAILLPSQPRKGRTRRGRQRKDFQSEILPSIASLSRNEVTEDLQTIGGLMEAAGSRWETGSLRNKGRSGGQRGRRRSCVSASSLSLTENTVGSQLNQQPGNSELGIEERSLIGWGKITRRRGGRCPVRNPKFILGQI